MKREPVSSSNLLSVGYDPDTETLEVEFKGNRVYEYYNVPPFLYERMLEAASIGKFFNQEIRNSFACNPV